MAAAGSTEQTSRWVDRRGAAFAVRAVCAAAPAGLSAVVVFLASRAIRESDALGPRVLWWIALLGLGFVLANLVARAAKRLLPLAVLFRLTVAFPDAAPSRFSLALRRGSVKKLARDPDSLNENAAELLRQVSALHVHDRRTRGHGDRVRAYSAMLGEEFRLTPDDADKLQWAALLHDIGKVEVSPRVLNKPGDLTEAERELVRRHPEAARRRMEPLRTWLGEWTDAPAQHHERWDGAGYPLGLAGANISLGGRIVAVADAYDVMTSARSYRKGMSAEAARAELTACSGTHFDPDVVRAFLSVSLGTRSWAQRFASVLAQLPVLGSVGSTAMSNAMTGIGAAALGAALVVEAPLVDSSSLPPVVDPVFISRTDATTAPVAPADGVQDQETSTTGAEPATTGSSIGSTTSSTAAPTTVVPPAPSGPPPGTTTPTTSAPAPPTGGEVKPSTTQPGSTTTGPEPTTTTTTTAPPPSPLAMLDEVTIPPGDSIEIEVTANDVDPYGTGLTVTAVGQPSSGAAMIRRRVVVRYFSNSDTKATDSFTYTISDGLGREVQGQVIVHFKE